MNTPTSSNDAIIDADFEDIGVGMTDIAQPSKSTSLVTLEIEPRAQMIKDLNQNISRNHYGLPDFIYRVDLLPNTSDWTSADPQSRIQLASQAELVLDYSQGFAALPNGDSFWSQLQYEGREDYIAFQHFLEMPRNKADGFKPVAPVRQLNLLKPITNKSSIELISLSYQYYWPERARAFDLYTIACHIKSKELRVESVENEQFTRAGKFIEYAETFLEGVFKDPEHYELTAKEAFDMMFKMMQAQRLSVGLNPTGAHAGKDENRAPANANLEVIMRTIAKNSGAVSDEGQSQSSVTQQLLANPDMLMQAQELIIRMGDIKNPRHQKQGDHFDE